MVIRSLSVLSSAVLVATSPTWLDVLSSWGSTSPGTLHLLPFSPYWVAVPAALAIGASWIYELSIADASGLQNIFPAAAFDLSRKPAAIGNRREGGSETESDADLRVRNPSVWKRLETDFQELLKSGSDLEASWHRSSVFANTTETWKIGGDYGAPELAQQFADIAETAGRLLIESPGYRPPLAAATMRQASHRDRWFCVLRDREIRTELHPATHVTAEGRVNGHDHRGAIRGGIEASIELCVQLMLEESLDDRSNYVSEAALGARMILPKQVG